MRPFLTFLILLLATNCFASDVGEVSFPNAGSKEAQEPFLRGLALLHNFEYEDAATAFQEAQKIDPDFAMAYWGEAMTHNHPIWMQQDREAAQKALNRLAPTAEARTAKAPTQREKDYLNTLEILYGEGEKQERDFRYTDAMLELHGKYPNDPDAAAFYALSLLGTAHKGRDETLYIKAAAVLEEVFRDYPNHPGAAHYLIHCYDDPVHAPLGMRAARVYSRIAPSAAHAQHMTSHIFIAMGMWNDVVFANEVAVHVANEARAKRGKPPTRCGHYNEWLMYGYLQQHRYEDAKEIARGCYAESSLDSGTSSHGMAGMSDSQDRRMRSFVAMRTRYLLDTEAWSDEIRFWSVGPKMEAEVQFNYEFANVFAALKSGSSEDAKKAWERLKIAGDELSKESREELDRQVTEIMRQQLEAMLLIKQEKTMEAIEMLRKLAAVEVNLPFSFGPPFVDKPTFELLGETLLASNHPKEAADAFRAALNRAPERVSSLLGLARASSAAGDSKTASQMYAKLREIWSRGTNLPKEINTGPVKAIADVH